MPNTFERHKEEPSALARNWVDLGARAIEKLKQSKSKISGSDVSDYIKTIKEQNSVLKNEIYIYRLNEFVVELMEDSKALESLIEVKELLLTNTDQIKLTDVWALKLKEIAQDENLLDVVSQIRSDLYKKDGELLKKILKEAAENSEKYNALLAGMVIGNCVKESYMWTLFAQFKCTRWSDFESYELLEKNPNYMKLLKDFSETKLKKNIDVLQNLLSVSTETQKSDWFVTSIKLLPILEYESLNWFHEWIKGINIEKRFESMSQFLQNSQSEKFRILLSELEPELRDFGNLILQSFIGSSFEDLDVEKLGVLLRKIHVLLLDQEYGSSSFFEKR